VILYIRKEFQAGLVRESLEHKWSLAVGKVSASRDSLVPLGEWWTGHLVRNKVAALPELPAILVCEVAISLGTFKAVACSWKLGGSCGSLSSRGWCLGRSRGFSSSG